MTTIQPSRSEVVKLFLTEKAVPDLAKLYSYAMEMQANVAQDGGQKVDGEFQGRQWVAWTDGIQTWKSFRIPYNAASFPEHDDKPLNYDFAKHVEGIGMTGWDWINKRTRWVAFDFDAITGHSERHTKKCSDDDLLEIRRRLDDIPWVTLRYSTSGKGLHLYVFVDDDSVVVNNHSEHAAIARSILSHLSGLAGYDFQVKVDTCGGNMWVWHRKQQGTQGLSLIKHGEVLTKIPINWQDHMKVITGHRRKNRPFFAETDEQLDPFEQLSSKRSYVKLDDEHKKLLEWIEINHPHSSWWDSDHHMLITHTFILQEAHRALGMRGFFKTVSTGSEVNDRNCFCFPLIKGGWAVRRYTIGVTEDKSWEHSIDGYTKCFFNRDPDLQTLARAYGAIEDTDGGYFFSSVKEAKEAANKLGAIIIVPDWAINRKCKLKTHKDGRLIAEIESLQDDHRMDPDAFQGWNEKGKKWIKIFNIKSTTYDPEIADYDEVVRHLVSSTDEDCGWVIRADNRWTEEPLTHVMKALKSMGEKNIDNIIGSAVFRRWQLTNIPFYPEFPGDRSWNRNAAQFAFIPTVGTDNLTFPTWRKVFDHVGQGLNGAIQQNGWAKMNGITTGAEYLICWVASMFQHPFEQLPYLFFYGAEDCGKTTIWESLALLLTRGFIRADHALTNQQGFNVELESAVLCIVEEVDLSKSKQAHMRIKDWVTSKHLAIHPKFGTPHLAPNTTHWMQTANSYAFCPVHLGDSRITMIDVPNFDLGEMIPKSELLELLRKEASDFLAHVLALELPPPSSRLRIPIIETEKKIAAQRATRTELQRFLDEEVYYVPGETIEFAEFLDKFIDWLDPISRGEYSRFSVSKQLPVEYPMARLPNGKHYIGNMSWEEPNGKPPKPLLIARQPEGKKYTYLVSTDEHSTNNL